MTAGERAVWIAVYAASWHQASGGAAGHVTDEERARWCVLQANRSVAALDVVREGGSLSCVVPFDEVLA